MPGPSLSSFECGGLLFDSHFDSGNIALVEQKDDWTFALYTRSDCEGSPHAVGFRSWFHFSFKPGPARGKFISFELHNMNPQGKLFKPGNDMRPVYRTLPSRPEWARLPLPCHHTGVKEEDNFVLHFRHKCECEPGDTIYIALSHAYSYTDYIARYALIDALFGLPPALVVGEEGWGGRDALLEQVQALVSKEDAECGLPMTPRSAAIRVETCAAAVSLPLLPQPPFLAYSSRPSSTSIKASVFLSSSTLASAPPPYLPLSFRLPSSSFFSSLSRRSSFIVFLPISAVPCTSPLITSPLVSPLLHSDTALYFL